LNFLILIEPENPAKLPETHKIRSIISMMGTRAKRIIEYADIFLDWNWIPIPLHDKIALPLNWPSTTAENALTQIQKFISSKDTNNLGLVTGATSNIVVVDVDVSKGGMNLWSLTLAKNGGLPESTFTVETGTGGRHIYFEYDSASDLININSDQGIDFRTDGGMVLAPWSLHPVTGRQYRPISGFKVSSDGNISRPVVAKMPNWVEQFLLSLNSTET
jgi:hypothetical protein